MEEGSEEKGGEDEGREGEEEEDDDDFAPVKPASLRKKR